MARLLLNDIHLWYTDLMDKRSDPRVKDWPMMSSPAPTLALCILYAYFSKSLGPKLMRNRKAFDLRKLLIYYNLCQTLFSAWMFYEYLMSGWWGHYNFTCQPVDYSNNPLALRMARTCWWYYVSKFTEFFDTLFFILRKKNEHVSTLHVIHHGCMPFSVWMGMKYAPGGHSTFFALLNTFVHVVMYFYYMISAMGPKYQKYIWWKKYLTTFQMPVVDDENDGSADLDDYKTRSNGIYKNGFTNGHILSTNEAILNSDTNTSSLHQRKVK
uniref:Elongation of very long chain fatty acids protein n=1 Tax=Glossina palpalis gambiensis TaxID=67801 RepID=A0A1B0C378_9MUSC